MDAIEYFQNKKRMCENFSHCHDCPLGFNNHEGDIVCNEFEMNYPEQADEIVEKWAAEHPVKTRQSELMKLFPNLERDALGMCTICPRHFDTKFECSRFSNCQECCENYWLKEIKAK